jgi:hypothetical protein
MSLLRYFRSETTLPTAEQTGIGARATEEANAAVEKIVVDSRSAATGTGRRRRKHYTKYSDKNRVAIGSHAAENGNSKALKRFKGSFPHLTESTVREFRMKCLAAVKKKGAQGDTSPVTSLPCRRMGRPLTLGELDTEVQQYIRALRDAGTPVGTSVITAGAMGIVM